MLFRQTPSYFCKNSWSWKFSEFSKFPTPCIRREGGGMGMYIYFLSWSDQQSCMSVSLTIILKRYQNWKQSSVKIPKNMNTLFYKKIFTRTRAWNLAKTCRNIPCLPFLKIKKLRLDFCTLLKKLLRITKIALCLRVLI